MRNTHIAADSGRRCPEPRSRAIIVQMVYSWNALFEPSPGAGIFALDAAVVKCSLALPAIPSCSRQRVLICVRFAILSHQAQIIRTKARFELPEHAGEDLIEELINDSLPWHCFAKARTVKLPAGVFDQAPLSHGWNCFRCSNSRFFSKKLTSLVIKAGPPPPPPPLRLF